MMLRLSSLVLLSLSWWQTAAAAEIYLRPSQVGYALKEPKVAIAFSQAPLPGEFTLKAFSKESNTSFRGRTKTITNAEWGAFKYHAELDFSSVHQKGVCTLAIGDAHTRVSLRREAFAELPGPLLEFMRQQRCGFNPWVNTNCHQLDGRTAYGPLPDATQIDARGGWHDAGDLLKYLITSANATAQMLLAYELEGKKSVVRGQYSERRSEARTPPSLNTNHWSLHTDRFDALGRPGSNGIPDLLDEARWGLEWMLKLHPTPDALYHQVADDRDHAGWRLPQNETVDYGWGKGGARVVYFADGKPQGLKQYQSSATGVANLAGRYAAAMALAYQIWKDDPQQKDFAARCLQAAREVYALGRAKEGYQQGNSYGAPYRYEETTWADDMEWGAAELYRATREKSFLEDAKRYAQLTADEGWFGKEQTGHYQYYPFMNAGHFRLYDLVDRQFKKRLAGYYRDAIERCVRAGEKNPYRMGAPFIWCSNNLLVALVTQCLMYERMTGDERYREFATKQRDWLVGRNPWGTSMFTGIGDVAPKDVHLMTVQLLKRPVRGGLVDGPVYERIFKSLKGVSVTQPDPFEKFQGPAVYHDDVKDYSTNEPTMDGTASAILMWVLCAR